MDMIKRVRNKEIAEILGKLENQDEAEKVAEYIDKLQRKVFTMACKFERIEREKQRKYDRMAGSIR